MDPIQEGRRIALNYLSKLGWTKEWRRTVFMEIRPAWRREEEEEKFRTADRMLENAEADFSAEFEKLRKDPSPQAKEMLKGIYAVLKNRTDLGFFAKRIVERIRRML